MFQHRKVRIDAVISSKDAGKEVSAQSFQSVDEVQEPFELVDEIQEPFAQFTSMGARRISDSVDFDDFVRVFKFFHRIDHGASDTTSVGCAEDSRNKVAATAGVLSTRSDTARIERPFTRNPPPNFGQLIELVRCLPPHDSLEFVLLHPLIVGIEMDEYQPINLEIGMRSNAKFRRVVNKLFERSRREITDNRRMGIKAWGAVEVFDCAFWHSVSLNQDSETLTDEYWRLVLGKDYRAYRKMNDDQQRDFESENDDILDLLYWTRLDETGREVDLDRKMITFERALRFGLPRKLIRFIAGNNPLACSARMADLYESFYLLHDIAYMASTGYKRATLNECDLRRDGPTVQINDDGFVRIRKSLFWQILQEEQIRADQIRSCKLRNCRRIFWARARNQVCCTARCANLYEMHKKRYPTAEAHAAYIERCNKREQKRLQQKPKPGSAFKQPKRTTLQG